MTYDKINWIYHTAHPDTPNLERSSGRGLQIAPSKNAVPIPSMANTRRRAWMPADSQSSGSMLMIPSFGLVFLPAFLQKKIDDI